MNEPSYGTLTCEFLSSFTISSEGLLYFRITNKNYDITKTHLANMFDWQIAAQQPLPENYVTSFWLKIIRFPITQRYIAQRASALISSAPAIVIFLEFYHILYMVVLKVTTKFKKGSLLCYTTLRCGTSSRLLEFVNWMVPCIKASGIMVISSLEDLSLELLSI